MKRFAVIFLVFLVLMLLFSGCLNIKTTVKVNKDGSGQITQVFTLSSALSGMMNSAASTDIGTEYAEGEADSAEETLKAQDAREKLLDKEKLAEHAKEMGEGVKLVSAEPYEEGDFSGYKAIYSFKDVTKLEINQNPAELMPSDTMGEGAQPPEKENLTFVFKKGSPSTLTIIMPPVEEQTAKEKKSDANTEEMDEATLEMMREFYKDMRILMEIEVEGSITESNAQYRKGRVVTLMDMDFNKIMEDEKLFKSLSNNQVNTLEEMKELVKKVKGLKIELSRKVDIKFK